MKSGLGQATGAIVALTDDTALYLLAAADWGHFTSGTNQGKIKLASGPNQKEK